MQAQANIPSSLERNLTLSLPAVEIESKIASKLKQIARTAKMSGFRPGQGAVQYRRQSVWLPGAPGSNV